jgi:hypothetical protein
MLSDTTIIQEIAPETQIFFSGGGGTPLVPLGLQASPPASNPLVPLVPTSQNARETPDNPYTPTTDWPTLAPCWRIQSWLHARMFHFVPDQDGVVRFLVHEAML